MITISIGITWSRVLGNIDTISEFPRHLMKCTVFIFRKLSVLSERRRGEVAVSAGQAALNMVKWNSKAHATPASQRKYTVADTNTLGPGPVCSHKRRSNNLQWSDEKRELSENGSPRYPLLRWYSLLLRLGRGGEAIARVSREMNVHLLCEVLSNAGHELKVDVILAKHQTSLQGSLVEYTLSDPERRFNKQSFDA